MKKVAFERKLTLKKEGLSQLQPNVTNSIKGGQAEFLSIVSCDTNGRTCGNNCCGCDTRHRQCTCCCQAN
ncbi:MAG: class I lanthipeptide [Dinghuibacter sp.]|nr:class I lanthipeptide [Dinghuibacter sp.]